MKNFWLCFVPLFVAVDAIIVLPVFIGFTQEIEKSRIRSGKMILIEEVEGRSVKDQSVEIVERKGRGHPEISFTPVWT